MYDAITEGGGTNNFKHIWKAKIPHKIKIFMWLLENRAVLTKDNMIRRKWSGDPSCYFCNQPETGDHLFFQCPIAKLVWSIVDQCLGATNTPQNTQQYKSWINHWLPEAENVHTFGLAAICWALWKCRNKACFDKKLLKNPIEIIIHSCSFMTYWTGLHSEDFQGKLLDGVQVLLSCAHKVLARSNQAPVRLALPPTEEDEEEAENEN